MDLLIEGQQLVVFPEGKINRNSEPIRLASGLVRLAQLASKKGVEITVLPIGIGYSEVIPRPLGKAAICFSKPIKISVLGKEAALNFNKTLTKTMNEAEEKALEVVGRKR